MADGFPSSLYAGEHDGHFFRLQYIAMNPKDLELLVAWTMPYGKYRDRLLADLPGHYLTWFAHEGFPEGKLGQLLALMHEIDQNELKSLLDPLRDRKRLQQ